MSNELIVRPQVSLFPSESEWKIIREQASIVVKTGFLPRAIDTPEKAIAIALKGRELGIPMMQAFSHIHIIEGKPTISSELMLSQIYKHCAGAVINYLENDEKRCVIEARRPGHKAATFSYTIEEARQAELLNKGNWKKYPAAMLRARTVAITARAMFPDAIMGCSYTPEELGAEVNDEGLVLEVMPPTTDKKPTGDITVVPPKSPVASPAPQGKATLPKPNPSLASATSEDPGAFVVSIGKKYNGMRLDAIDTAELADWHNYLNAGHTENPVVLKTIAAVEAYLIDRGYQPRG